MPLTQLIYASQPFGFDDLALSSILASAARNNRRDGITGALICREDLFVQLLEGPTDLVAAAFTRIARDDRHTNIVKYCEDPVEARLFPEWAMRHDPAQSWMWTREQVSQGAIDDATAGDMRSVFTRLAAEPPTTAQTCPFRA